MAVSDPLADYTGEKVIGTLLVCHLPLAMAKIQSRQARAIRLYEPEPGEAGITGFRDARRR